MASNHFFSVTTRRFTLRCSHEDWLRMTQELFNEIIMFYYLLFVGQEEKAPGSLTSIPPQLILRKLEVLTITGRDKNEVPYPLPFKKIPLYFRRAAINEAASSARTYFAGQKAEKYVGKTKRFQKGITFYKGMYRELTDKNITLKVWNGQAWIWMTCRISGNFIPENTQTLSPCVCTDSKGAVLSLPVKTEVEDGRRAEERMRKGCRICSFQFANEDYFAVGVILDENGKQQAVRFFRGGREYSHRCREILSRINSSQQAMGLKERKERLPQTDEKYNQKYWTKYKNIRRHYSHSISRQMVEFCCSTNAAVITLPKYDEKYTKCVMQQTEKTSPVHLSKSIQEQLYYKAWQSGIIVLEVNARDTSGTCSLCGMAVKKRKDQFFCPNGHGGNKFINTARNSGVKCLKSFGRNFERGNIELRNQE